MAFDDNVTSRTSGMAKRNQTDANRWATMLSMINKTAPQTLMGYGLGRLLRKGWDDYLYNRHKTQSEDKMKPGLLGNMPTINGGVTGINFDDYSIVSPNDYTLSAATADALLNPKQKSEQEAPTTNNVTVTSVSAPKQTLLDMAKNTDPNVVYDLWGKRALGNLINQR